MNLLESEKSHSDKLWPLYMYMIMTVRAITPAGSNVTTNPRRTLRGKSMEETLHQSPKSPSPRVSGKQMVSNISTRGSSALGLTRIS